MIMKSKLKKEHGKVMFVEKVDLFKTRSGASLKENNLELFDKTILEYKKHYMCLTKNELVFVGFSHISTAKEGAKTYKKVYKLTNIEKVHLTYKTSNYTTTGYKTQTSYRKVTTESGKSYTDKVEEEVPYEVQNSIDIFLYGYIDIKSSICAFFHFTNWRKSLAIVNKFIKVCSKLNISSELEEFKE